VQSLFVVTHARFHEQTRDTILHAVDLGSGLMPCDIPAENRSARQSAILPASMRFILFLGCRDGAQHQGMRHFYLGRMRKQMIARHES